jgi:RNA polymerase sigma-70 factor (ECF subfamily)
MADPDRTDLETALRAAILAGDVSAWRAFYDSCFARVCAFVSKRVGGRPELAEDLVEECWLVAVRRIREFDPSRGSFAAWMRGIAENAVRNGLRRERRRSHEPLLDDPEAAPTDTEGGADLSRRIDAVYEQLPPRYREILKAKYESRLAVAEIATRRGETRKTVESLLSRARAAFRKTFLRWDECDP